MALDGLGMSGLCILAILTFWFLITIPNQFSNGFGKVVRENNVFGLIPRWTFFAPNPGTSDYRLVFRDLLPDGPSDWHEVEWCHSRRALDALWQPDRHRKKLIVDCVSALTATMKETKKPGMNEEDRMQPWMLSVPYMALLNVVLSMPRTSDGIKARQFAIIEQKPSQPGNQPRLLMRSSEHEL